MNAPPASPSRALRQISVLQAAGLIVLASIIAYFNSFNVPFVFDDLPNIEKNGSIRQFWSFDALNPPPSAAGTVGRPLVNLSLAFNHALGGLNVGGYHAFNLIVHLLAGLALFGVVRRTLALPVCLGAPGAEARSPFPAADGTAIAAVIAALWVVHPLQTESVVGVIQRTELLVGVFYLLTFYCFLRSVEPGASRRWQAAVIGSTLIGTGCKEVMATAPVLLFLFDSIFVAGKFRAAWALRRSLYVGLMATWILLAFLMVSSGQRSGTVGFGLGMTSWEYLLTQCQAIGIYLKLVFWPHPLVLDYGYPAVRSLLPVLPQALLLTGLALATIGAVQQRRALGFAGAWFFVILGPSSSLVPLTTQTIAEHRMYLPLAALIALIVLGLYRWLGRRALLVSTGLIAVSIVVTLVRNHDYRSPLAIWADTAAKAPTNARAQTNWGNALVRLGRGPEAIARYEEAIRLDPGYAEARHNLGLALLQAGQADASLAPFTVALRLRPDDAEGHRNFGRALAMLGRMPEALAHYEKAAQLEPDHAEGLGFLGWALLGSNRAAEAIPNLEKALGIEPDSFNIRVDLANALVEVRRIADALPHYEAAARLMPDDAGVHYNWGAALMQAGRRGEAVARFETAVRLNPDDADARATLARARREAGLSP